MQASHPRKAGAGFTLLELMIVVVIIAILAAIAVPSYLKYVQQGRRSDAMAGLAQAQGILERCYAANFDYSKVTASPAVPGCVSIPAFSPNGYYAIALVPPVPSATAYTIQATPVPGLPQASDTPCLLMTINNENVQTPTATSGATNCWAQ